MNRERDGWDYLGACFVESWAALRRETFKKLGAAVGTLAAGYLAAGVVGKAGGAQPPLLAFELWKLGFAFAVFVLAQIAGAGFRLWKKDQTQLAEIATARDAAAQVASAAVKRAEELASRPAPATAAPPPPPQPPSNVDLAIAHLRSITCPGPKLLSGAQYFVEAYPLLAAKRSQNFKLAELAGVAWPFDKREAGRVAFQTFLHGLAQEDLVVAPQAADGQWLVTELGRDVWRRLRGEAASLDSPRPTAQETSDE